MKKTKAICFLTSLVGIVMISMGLVIQSEKSPTAKIEKKTSGYDIKNMSATSNMIVKDNTNAEEKTLLLTVLQRKTEVYNDLR